MSNDTESVQAGCLYVVATPIGNLGDLSSRALKILDTVDLVAAEDTRTSGTLLSHFGIRGRLQALHEHNESEVCDALVTELQSGKSVALVSDAGTPLLNDPGFRLVRAARAAGCTVVAVPGPSAITAALSIAGVPTDRFSFEGFLPSKAEARHRRLQELASAPHTLVLFESPHRIVASLQAVVEVFGADRMLCLARELTKRFEQSHTASAQVVLDWLQADANRQRGEFVLVVAGCAENTPALAQGDAVLRTLLAELSPSRAARVAAELTGLPRRELYERAMELGGKKRPAPHQE